MKRLVALSLATTFAFGLFTAAQAVPLADYEADVLEAAPGVAGPVLDAPYHPCHGRSSGTAHSSCGTATGGPSGGLF